MKQFLHAMAPDRCDNAKLGKMGADRIDHRRLLTDQKMACAMEHQATLLLSCLGRHEAHISPGHRLAYGFSVCGVVLMPLDVRLHIGWRHQPHGMAKGLQLTRPMMCGSTGFNPDHARRQLLEECQHIASLDLAAHGQLAIRIGAPWTWKTDFAISRPIVAIACMPS